MFYSWRPKTQRKSVTASWSNQSWWMRNEHGLLVPKQKRQRAGKLHISIGMSVFKCGTALMLISQKTAVIVTVLQISSYSFSHMHLFIAPRMSKSAVHHLWNLGRKWLNMVSTDTCTCIHQHYFSRVIVDLLFFLFVWWRMKPVDEDINSMATKWSTAAWTHQISAVQTAFMNSSTVTAQMLRPIKETSQLHNCKIVVEGFF